jgi:hypothetical protein
MDIILCVCVCVCVCLYVCVCVCVCVCVTTSDAVVGVHTLELTQSLPRQPAFTHTYISSTHIRTYYIHMYLCMHMSIYIIEP